MHVRIVTIAVVALASGVVLAQQTPPPDAQAQAAERQRRQDAVPDTPGTGRYAALKEIDPTLAEHVTYRPANLDSLGSLKLGIYVFGNGGCTDDGASARLHLLEIASHGYLAIAPGRIYNGPGKTQRPATRPAPTGPGGPAATVAAQLREALDWALAENTRAGSRYFGRIDPNAVAISGYSCGGVQALANAKDPRIATVVIMNSGLFVNGPTRMGGIEVGKELLADLHTPTLYILGGSTDIAYANGMDDFARIAHVPVAVANIETGHGGTYWEPNGGAAAQVVVDWLNWQLRGYRGGNVLFLGSQCVLCNDPKWKLETKGFPPPPTRED